MRNNIKVAQCLLEMISNGKTITRDTLAKASGVHNTVAGQFLSVWAAAGWMTKKKQPGRQPLVFSATAQGVEGLTNLINKHNQA